MSFKAYMQGVEEKSGNSPENLCRIANEKGFIKEGKIVAAHKQLLSVAQRRNRRWKCTVKLL
jgi:hypothetical protein